MTPTVRVKISIFEGFFGDKTYIIGKNATLTGRYREDFGGRQCPLFTKVEVEVIRWKFFKKRFWVWDDQFIFDDDTKIYKCHGV